MTIAATSPSARLRHPIIALDRAAPGLAVPRRARSSSSRSGRASTDGTSFHLQRLQPPVDRGLRHGAAAAGARPDLRHHLRRHRPVARLHHGPVVGDRGARGQLSRRGARPAALRSRCWSASLRARRSRIIPGLVNGLLISRLQVPPFIGTLGMYGVARGAAYLLRRRHDRAGRQRLVSRHRQRPRLRRSGPGHHHRRSPAWSCTTCCRRPASASTPTRIGASKAAASRAGIDVKWLTLQDLSALGGDGGPRRRAMYTGRFTAGAPQAGEPLLLDSIAAVVIGGASLFGGSGTIAARSPARWSSPSSSTVWSSSMSSRSGSSSPSASSSSSRCWSTRPSAASWEDEHVE